MRAAARVPLGEHQLPVPGVGHGDRLAHLRRLHFLRANRRHLQALLVQWCRQLQAGDLKPMRHSTRTTPKPIHVQYTSMSLHAENSHVHLARVGARGDSARRARDALLSLALARALAAAGARIDERRAGHRGGPRRRSARRRKGRRRGPGRICLMCQRERQHQHEGATRPRAFRASARRRPAAARAGRQRHRVSTLQPALTFCVVWCVVLSHSKSNIVSEFM